MSIPDIATLLKKLPERKETDRTLVEDQDVFDIVHHTLRMHKKYGNDYDLISKYFWNKNAKGTAQTLFDFCKENIDYEPEDKERQTVRNPRRILQDAMAGKKMDCKHYGAFTMGVIDSLHRQGYPINGFFRFATDVKNEQYPRHVFSVVEEPKGNIWVDPVLKRLNQFHNYYYFLDKKPPKVPLIESISGISYAQKQRHSNYVSGMDDSIFGGTESNYVGKVKKQHKGLFKKLLPGKFLLKITMAPSRNAMLAMLKANLFQIAHHFYVHGQTQAGINEMKKIWSKIGGDWKHFYSAVNQGERVEKKHHRSKIIPGEHTLSGNQYSSYIGFAGPDDAAYAAIASAALAFFAPLLKKLGVNTSDINKAVSQGTSALANLATQADANGILPDGTQLATQINAAGQQILSVPAFQGNAHEGPDAANTPPLSMSTGQAYNPPTKGGDDSQTPYQQSQDTTTPAPAPANISPATAASVPLAPLATLPTNAPEHEDMQTADVTDTTKDKKAVDKKTDGGMEVAEDGWKGFFGKVTETVKEHPVAISVGVAAFLFRKPLLKLLK